MAVKVAKSIQAPPEPAIDISARKDQIDRYGELQRMIAIFAPIEAEARLLKIEIEGWHAKDKPGAAFTERGHLYAINISACRNERTVVDKRKAFNRLKEALGLDGVIGVVQINLATIDRYIPASEQKAFIAEERSGYRTFEVVALHPAAGPKAEA
jgi:hypothetical protein